MGNTPAQVTEAHNRIVEELLNTRWTHRQAAQLIADSEARACDQLRAEVESRKEDNKAMGHWIAGKMLDPEWDSFKKSLELINHWKARAERAEAELAKERARLDWLEFRGPWEAWSEPCNDAEITLRGPIRAAIDAVMKEAAP